jgi:hypothetical protein
MFDFLGRVFCCGGARTANVETIKTTLLETKSGLSEVETLKATIQELQDKDQAYQNILIKMQDQLNGNTNVSLISQLEGTIRKLRSANAKLQENATTADTATLDGVVLDESVCNIMLEKTNVFATSFKHSFHQLVTTQQSTNPKSLTYWENINMREDYSNLFEYLSEQNGEAHHESINTIKHIADQVIYDLIKDPKFIEYASQASDLL